MGADNEQGMYACGHQRIDRYALVFTLCFLCVVLGRNAKTIIMCCLNCSVSFHCLPFCVEFCPGDHKVHSWALGGPHAEDHQQWGHRMVSVYYLVYVSFVIYFQGAKLALLTENRFCHWMYTLSASTQRWVLDTWKVFCISKSYCFFIVSQPM